VKNFLATFFLLFAFHFELLAQSQDWVNLTKENSGLPTNSIRQVVQDKKGIYWIATVDSGLVRFDGKTWKVFNTKNSPLPNDYVYTITFDKKGALWIGTYGGGLVFFDSKDRWKIYNQKNSGLTCDWIYCVAIDKKSNVWIGTYNGGLNIYDGKKWKVYRQENSILNSIKVTYIYFDKKDDVWLGTGSSLFKMTKGTLKSENDFGYKAEDNTCYWITDDKKGNIYFCYKFGSIVSYNWKEFRIMNRTNSCLPFIGYYSVALDNNDILWAGSFGHGLLKLQNGNCEIFDKTNSVLRDNLIFNVRVDDKNNKWLSTFSSGIYVFNELGVKF
jgi:ligand-binding sensor domain-containing protein